MKQYDDLQRMTRAGASALSESEAQEIIGLANRHLSKCGYSGIIIIPLLYFIAAYTTHFGHDHPRLFQALGMVMILASLGRSHAALNLRGIPGAAHIGWERYYFLASLAQGICWGLTGAATLHYYGAIWDNVIILYILAGIAGGSIASYSNWLRLNQYYLAALFLPLIIMTFRSWEQQVAVIGLLSCVSLVYNLGQARLWNKVYWESLINTFLLEREIVDHHEDLEILRQEIYERQAAQKEHRLSEAKHKETIESTREGYIRIAPNLRTIYTNQAFLGMLGFPPEKQAPSTILELLDHDNIPLLLGNEGAPELKEHRQIELCFLNQYQQSVPVLINISPLVSGEGEPIEFFAFVSDLTALKEAELELLHAKEVAEAASKAKSEFLANMSHEMRTPLHAILGFANFGRKRSQQVPRTQLAEYFTLINDSGQRLLTLLTDLLDLTKLEVGNPHYDIQAFDINLSLAVCLAEIQDKVAQNGITISFQEDTPNIALFDRHRLIQVLHNLLDNAIKFSPHGTTISITIEELMTKRGPCRKVQISDQGIGIPKEELRDIFHKFTQSSRSNTGAGGTGLGLAISKGIIKDHSGLIWAENNPTSGASLFFTLPLPPAQGAR